MKSIPATVVLLPDDDPGMVDENIHLFGMLRRPGDWAVQVFSTFIAVLAASEFVTALALSRPAWHFTATVTRLVLLLALVALVTLLPGERWSSRWRAPVAGILTLLALSVVVDPRQVMCAVLFAAGVTVLASLRLVTTH